MRVIILRGDRKRHNSLCRRTERFRVDHKHTPCFWGGILQGVKYERHFLLLQLQVSLRTLGSAMTASGLPRTCASMYDHSDTPF